MLTEKYCDDIGSQKYPPPLGSIYPLQGNFIGFIGNTASGSLVRDVIASFRRHTQFPSEGAALPSQITAVGWSDHWSFWQQGYPGVMVTDTAPFRYPYYHTAGDTPNKVDYERLARVVVGARAGRCRPIRTDRIRKLTSEESSIPHNASVLWGRFTHLLPHPPNWVLAGKRSPTLHPR